MLINVSGSFLLGVVFGLMKDRVGLDPVWKLFLTTGLIAGYTTYSTFAYEAVAFVLQGLLGTAVLYVAASVVLGIAAVYLGIAAARAAGA